MVGDKALRVLEPYLARDPGTNLSENEIILLSTIRKPGFE